uniref:Uncharacterized protein n=1 Tax=Acrobeloides nanus TaxID=290746 RepID=A0A914C1Z8_9BILA
MGWMWGEGLGATKSSSKSSKHTYTSFQDPIYGDFGLRDEQNAICLYLKFHAKLYNFNLNGTDIASELADLTSPHVNITGRCALSNELRKSSQIQAVWKVHDRRKLLYFKFEENFVKTLSHQVDELRWQLKKVVYTESFGSKLFSSIIQILEKFLENSIRFESANDTNVMSAPLRQKFVCKDRLNISLHNPDPEYKDIVLEFLPEVDVQPVNTGYGYGSNVYVCERTRRRTLAESFQSRMTIFSGVVLGTSSVGAMVAYSLRRHFLPSRQQFYNSLQ